MRKVIDRAIDYGMLASWFFAAGIITAGIWIMTYGDSRQIPLD